MQATAQKPTSLNYLNTANKNLRQGNFAEAITNYQKAIQLNPKSSETLTKTLLSEK